MYDVADGHNEVACLAGLYDGLHDALHVGFLVVVARTLVQQFLNDVGKLSWQGLADLAAGVLAADRAADLYELEERACVEAGEVLFGVSLQHLQSFLRVVDEGAEFAHVAVGQRVGKEVVHLALDVAAGIAQDVQEGLVLAVYVGHEVLGALRQTEDGFEVDDFGACALAVGKCLRKELQQTHIGVGIHSGSYGSNGAWRA